MLADRLVDVHAHYLPAALIEAYARRCDVPRLVERDGARLVDMGGGIAYPLFPEMVDPNRQIELMDVHGVSVSLVTVTPPGIDRLHPREAVAVARACNDELADLGSGSGGRLAALATLPSQRPDAAADELQRAVSIGLRGAQLYSNVDGRRLDEPAFAPVFDVASELDVPIVLHPTTPVGAAAISEYALATTLGFLIETTQCALRLAFEGLYVRHPGFKLVVPHVGAVIPYILGRIDYEAARHPGGSGVLEEPPSEHLRRFYVDSVCVWPPALRLAIDVLGTDRVLFGTDVPFWEIGDSLAALETLDLPAEAAARICHGNADSLFRLAPASA